MSPIVPLERVVDPTRPITYGIVQTWAPRMSSTQLGDYQFWIFVTDRAGERLVTTLTAKGT